MSEGSLIAVGIKSKIFTSSFSLLNAPFCSYRVAVDAEHLLKLFVVGRSWKQRGKNCCTGCH